MMKQKHLKIFCMIAIVCMTAGSSLPITAAASDASETAEYPDSAGSIRFAKDYQEVYEKLKDSYYGYYPYDTGTFSSEIAVEENAAMDSASAGTAYETKDYSDTNIREAGVDEADIVKTDGKYLYLLKDSEIRIVHIENGMEITAVIHVTDDSTNLPVREFFLNGNTLTALACGAQHTYLIIYDITNRQFPELKKQICQDGSYYTSRMKDGFLYSFSIWQPEIGETFETSDLIPLIDGKELPATDICIPRYINYPEYILISSVDTANAADGVQNTKAMIASPEELYVSKENIYTLSPYYKGNHRQTEIIKFHYEKNEITGIASAVAKGYIDSSFSIDEYDGNLRVVTTYESADILSMIDYFMGDSWNYTSRKNGLFIYNEKLELIGTAAGLARNQEIKSARFMGNTAYFVTFENTDPLYSADLTDPESPKILGKLHIPGFSSYLHPFGENLLLGLGYDADEKNGQITGLKLSMFDTSDMKDVKETDKFVINGITYCSALDNYKAIFADKDKSLVGFYHDNRYMVFRYDPQEGFDRVLLYDLYEDMLNGSRNTGRLLYAGNTLFATDGSYIIAFDMKDFSKKDVLKITE